MAFPKNKRRKIVVDDEEYYWMVSDELLNTQDTDFNILLTLRIHSACQSKRVEARFFGTEVYFVFSDPERSQNVAITPSVVRDVIVQASEIGWTKGLKFDYAERLFQNAVTPMDVKDTQLSAACQQWFAPYPGREALTEGYANSSGDISQMSKMFPDVEEEELAHWLDFLEITNHTT